MRKHFWLRIDWGPWEEVEKLVSVAVNSGCEAVVCSPEHVEKIERLGKIRTIVSTKLLRASSAKEVLEAARVASPETVLLVEVKDKETERAVTEVGRCFSCVVVKTSDWKVIPLENLIANLHGKVPLLAEVQDEQEAKLVLETLELGVDGVVLFTRRPSEVEKVARVVEKMSQEVLRLEPARVVCVKQMGLGDRACVDTVAQLNVGEGMLVGSQAEGLFLVHSETLPSPFVEPRPFRVNAGAIHSYIMVPGGRTRYLSELRMGDEVLAVDSTGRGRAVGIGRVKIERRPLILIQAECGGRVYGVILQNAETINLVDKNGNPVPVTKLKEGDEVLIHRSEGGRHFGVRVEETVIER